MESIIFDYIGYVLIFCSALCLVAPVVVHLVSIILGVVWKVVDEGDSKAPDLLNKVMPFLFSDGVELIADGKWAVHEGNGDYLQISGECTWCLNDNILKYCAFDSKEEAKTLSNKFNICHFNFKLIFTLTLTLSLLGLGFTFMPTITMYSLSSALCLISLRWSRRCYKKVKNLKVALDEHAKDKAAHK
jgi:hypothetical protein